MKYDNREIEELVELVERQADSAEGSCESDPRRGLYDAAYALRFLADQADALLEWWNDLPRDEQVRDHDRIHAAISALRRMQRGGLGSRRREAKA